MTHPSRFLSAVVARGRTAWASFAAEEFVELHPGLAGTVAGDPFAAWRSVLVECTEALAAAAAADCGEVFARQVRWSQAVLRARGVSPEAFRKALEVLGNVLSRELPPEPASAAEAYLARAREGLDDEPPGTAPRLSADSPYSRTATKYLLTLLEGNRRAARDLILDAVRDGSPIADLYLEVLQPAQLELGRMWADNEITVAEEHFASSTTRTVMAQLLAAADCRPPNGKTFLAASVAGNQHDLGLQMVADFFEIDGWRVIALGANMPPGDLVAGIDFFSPDLIGLSASLSVHLPPLGEAITAIRSSPRSAQLRILGGGGALAGLSDLPGKLGLDAYAADAREALSAGRTLVGLPAQPERANPQ